MLDSPEPMKAGERNPWLRSVLVVVIASVVAVAGCSRSSDEGISWEQEHAMAVEAFQQGRYAEAETRLVSALKKAQQFAVGDSRLATNLDSLAFFYSTQLKHAEAEPLYRRLLTIKEKALGPIHPDVATTLNNLAKQYQAQGKYAEAERLYQRALTIDEKVLGPNHPNVAVILESYVALLRETNRTEDAARLLAAHTKGDGSRGTLPICPD